MRITIIILMCFLLGGCCAKAVRYEENGKEYMTLSGIGSKSAKWSDGSEITREEPLKVPELPELHYKRED